MKNLIRKAWEAAKAWARKHLDPRNEPVMTAYAATVIVRLALSQGFDVDEAALSAVLEPFIAGAFATARQYVSPTKRT